MDIAIVLNKPFWDLFFFNMENSIALRIVSIMFTDAYIQYILFHDSLSLIYVPLVGGNSTINSVLREFGAKEQERLPSSFQAPNSFFLF